MTEIIEETPAQAEARVQLRVAVGAVQEALEGCANVGLDSQAEMMRMISEAFAASGEPMPPMLRMLLG